MGRFTRCFHVVVPSRNIINLWEKSYIKKKSVPENNELMDRVLIQMTDSLAHYAEFLKVTRGYSTHRGVGEDYISHALKSDDDAAGAPLVFDDRDRAKMRCSQEPACSSVKRITPGPSLGIASDHLYQLRKGRVRLDSTNGSAVFYVRKDSSSYDISRDREKPIPLPESQLTFLRGDYAHYHDQM